MKKFLAFVFCSLLLVGCGQKVANPGASIQISKSATNTEKINVLIEDQTDLKKLMNRAGIDFETEMHGSQEFMRTLSGVIATANKSWKLYINSKIHNFTKLSDVKINKQVIIEWRYEENK